eukprot:scaffold1727_cov133-Cylindrotheca_fusiformis.AAC.65
MSARHWVQVAKEYLAPGAHESSRLSSVAQKRTDYLEKDNTDYLTDLRPSKFAKADVWKLSRAGILPKHRVCVYSTEK